MNTTSLEDFNSENFPELWTIASVFSQTDSDAENSQYPDRLRKMHYKRCFVLYDQKHKQSHAAARILTHYVANGTISPTPVDFVNIKQLRPSKDLVKVLDRTYKSHVFHVINLLPYNCTALENLISSKSNVIGYRLSLLGQNNNYTKEQLSLLQGDENKLLWISDTIHSATRETLVPLLEKMCITPNPWHAKLVG